MVELTQRRADLTTFVAVGDLSSSELFEAYCAFLDSGPTPLALFDLSSATLAGIDPESLRQLARRIAQLGKQRDVCGKAAIVCCLNVDFYMARMFSAFASVEGHPVQFAAFPGLNSARAWLAGETH